MALDKLFQLMAEKNASDLFISAGSPVTIKINGVCVPVNQERLVSEQVIGLLAERLTDAHFRELEEQRELNLGLPVPGLGSFRLSAFLQRGSVSAVVRFIPHDVPRLDTLTLPDLLKELILEKRGLILVVGAAGSGKSTTIASMIDHRNELTSGHVLTFEDPIEFNFRNKKSIINQREIGADALTLQAAMRNAMRQAPDVMFIASLKAIVSQRLVRARRGGRIPAVEILLNNGQMTSLIEQGDVPAIKDAMERSLSPGSQSFEQSLYVLLQKDLVTRDDALAAADSKNNLMWLINNAGKGQAVQAPVPSKGAEPTSFSEFTLNI